MKREVYEKELKKLQTELVAVPDVKGRTLAEATELLKVERFAQVFHLVSTVCGVAREGVNHVEVLSRCFPGGSITGAPKIRAMEIIEELEPNRRGLYCGSIGYWGCNGDLETNIAIRTIVHKGGVARFAAGGGVVMDSDADAEYTELNDKASIMRKVLASA